jgi:hypothetical protein
MVPPRSAVTLRQFDGKTTGGFGEAEGQPARLARHTRRMQLARSWVRLCGVGHPGFVAVAAVAPNDPDDGAKDDHFRSGGAGDGAGEGAGALAFAAATPFGVVGLLVMMNLSI